MKKGTRRFALVVLLAAIAIIIILALITPPAADKQRIGAGSIVEARHQERQKPMRLIANSDGMEVTAFGKTVEKLQARWEQFANTQVDVFNFCVSYAGFGKFLYRTKAGDIQLDREILTNNLVPELTRRNTDGLKLIIDIFHRNNRKVFCEFRINDVHDYAYKPDSRDFRMISSTFKQEHPELLFGQYGDRIPFGRWSSVDYGSPLVRSTFAQYVKEVCDDYDVDGVEINFWRHLPIFKSVGLGGTASPEEVAGLTRMFRDIRASADEAGQKRGRPILIAVNVPDSVDYALAQGIDLETWMRDDLIDIVLVGGYFMLNPLEYSLALGKKYNIPVYPVFYEPRVSDIPGTLYPKGPGWPPLGSNLMRHTLEAYRGRAMLAYDLGAPGLGVFNKGNPSYGFYKEIGSLDIIKFMDKLYFCSIDGAGLGGGGVSAGRYLKDGKRFQNLPTLSPNQPLALLPGKTLEIPILTAEQIAAAQQAGFKVAVECYLRVKNLQPSHLNFKFNGQQIGSGEYCKEGTVIGKFATNQPDTFNAGDLKGNWIKYNIPPEALQKKNMLAVSLKDDAKDALIYDAMLLVKYNK